MENMDIYNAVRNVPDSAKKTISAGRLKGMTDINPMWRIQVLTERFGPCGIGWKYTITDKRLETGADGVVVAFVDIGLFYKVDGEWSEAVPGTGGSSLVAKERNGLYTSDECFKMALTDALSVACKALGVGADVYWAAGRTKYNQAGDDGGKQEQRPPFQHIDPLPPPICDRCGAEITPFIKNGQIAKSVNELVAFSQKEYQLTLCKKCIREVKGSETA